MAIIVDGKMLTQAVKKAKNMLNFKDARPWCHALRFEFEGSTCRIVAVDEYRVGVFELPFAGKSQGDFTIEYVPMDFGVPGDVSINYDAEKKTVTFRGEHTIYQLPVKDEGYPNWQRPLDIHEKELAVVHFNRQLLIKTLQSMTDERVIFNIYGPTNPVIMTGEFGKNKRLQLPMRPF